MIDALSELVDALRVRVSVTTSWVVNLNFVNFSILSLVSFPYFSLI